MFLGTKNLGCHCAWMPRGSGYGPEYYMGK